MYIKVVGILEILQDTQQRVEREDGCLKYSHWGWTDSVDLWDFDFTSVL